MGHRMTPFKHFREFSGVVPKSLPDPLVAHRFFLNDTEWDRLPETLQKAPYFQDGRVLFKVIEKFVRAYAEEMSMCKDDLVVDPDAILFRDAVLTLNAQGSFPGLNNMTRSCEFLVQRTIAVIWTVTGYHRHV